MASLLRRSKSTRDTRRRGFYNDQPPEGPFPFTITVDPVALLSPSIQRSQSTTGKSRAGGVREEGSHASSVGSARPPPVNLPTQTPRLGRSKSISSTRPRESMMALGLSEEWNPPAAANPADRKRRMSIFFGLGSPAPPQTPTTTAQKRVPPPPIRLSAFPPRPSSKRGPEPQQTLPSLAENEVGVAIGPEEECVIGMALGSPTEGLKPSREMAHGFRSVETLNIADSKSPGFRLPEEPFVVESPCPALAAATQAQSRPKSSGRSRKGSKGSDKRPTSRDEIPEPPKTAGWKRVFGKGLFSWKTTKPPREPTPEIPEPPKTARLQKPRAKEAGKAPPRTPCLDVTIPCVEMERYSVMFGNLLPPSEKSSLFARRRSKDMYTAAASIHSQDSEDFNTQDALSKLNGTHQPSPPPPVPTLQVTTLKRNSTTGAISPRSPLSRLGDDLRRLSSESRRSASPAIPSPAIPSPAPSPAIGRSHTIAADGRLSPYPRPPSTYLLNPPPLDYTTQGEIFFQVAAEPTSTSASKRCSKISEESLSPRGSFESGDDEEWMTGGQREPEWEMIKPAPQPRKTPSVPAEEEEEEETDGIAVAAQISIARQISLSQRQLLIPIVPKNQMLVNRESIKESAAAAAPMKPRLVEHKRISSVARPPVETVAV